jgi:hypothetical protein
VSSLANEAGARESVKSKSHSKKQGKKLMLRIVVSENFH